MESIRTLIKKNQKAVMGLVGLALLFIVYNTFLKSDEGPGLVSESRGIRDIEVGRKIITTLNRLKTIEIEPGIIEDPLFQQLVDFSKPLPDFPKSKRNPFIEESAGAVQGLISVDNPVENNDLADPVNNQPAITDPQN